jgi:hypothetical protein
VITAVFGARGDEFLSVVLVMRMLVFGVVIAAQPLFRSLVKGLAMRVVI